MTDMQMNYEAVEEMIFACQRASQRFDEAISNMQQAAGCLQGGALLGTEGERLLFAITQRLIPKLDNGRAKFGEIANDLYRAMEAMRNADNSSGRLFY
jgi:hypothetical protein